MAPTTRGNSQGASTKKTRQPLSLGRDDDDDESLRSLSPGEATIAHTLSAPLSLDERIQAAERRRDELQRLQRLQTLEAEIAELESRQGSVTPPTVGETTRVTPGLQDNDTRKRSAAQALTPPQPRRSLRPKDPPEYKGKTLKEHREFCRSCEVAFRLLPQEFSYNRDKVLWAMQYIVGEPRELWYTHYERTFEACGETPTWEYFKDYMLDLLSDPINRTLEAATAHAQAMQRRDQTVRSFATYLEVLEDQLTPYTEEQRVQHLFSKLRPEIQRAITNYHQVPATREELVALGSTLEKNLRRASPTRDAHLRGKFSTKPKERGLTEQSTGTFATRAPRDKNSVTCFKCQRTGHYANECKSSNPNQIPVRIQQTGKGKASLGARQQ